VLRVGEQEPRRLVGERRQQVGGELRVGGVDPALAAAQRRGELRHHGGAAARDRLVQHGRRALAGDEHEPPRRGVCLHRLQVGVERGHQALPRLAACERRGQHLGELAERAGALAGDERVEQAGEVVEVAVDDRAADPGVARDALDRDGVEAALDDDRLRDVEQLLAPRLGGHADGCACGHGHGHVTEL
jgi:hypothetical protein